MGLVGSRAATVGKRAKRAVPSSMGNAHGGAAGARRGRAITMRGVPRATRHLAASAWGARAFARAAAPAAGDTGVTIVAAPHRRLRRRDRRREPDQEPRRQYSVVAPGLQR